MHSPRTIRNRIAGLGHSESGVTLVEMLAAVGILVIMFALLVPAIFSLRTDLRQTELDTKAETIYLAAQNRITKLRSGGNVKAYAKQGTNTPGTGVYALPADPSDRSGAVDEEGNPIDSSELCYMTYLDLNNDGTASNIVMSRGTVDDELRLNRWVIELDPSGASVYAVWYSEGERLEDYGSEWDTYDSLRGRGQRLADGAKVGYYGGDSESSQTGLQLRPVISISNKEKLTVTVQCEAPGIGTDRPKLAFDVTLSDNEGHSTTTTYTYMGLNRLERLRNNYYLTLTLDDLSSEATRFDRLYGTRSGRPMDECLLPGTPLTISVRVRSENNMAVVPKTVSDTTNGLFANASNEHKDAQGHNDTAVIEYGRHLQNLSVLDTALYWSNPKTITKAVQANDLSFRSSEAEGSWHATYSAEGTTYFNGKTKGKVANFKPILPSTLVSYDGGGHVIEGLSMEGTGDMGLFGETYDRTTIKDVRLVGASVASTDGSVGALVGSTNGKLTVTGCQVYLSQPGGDLSGRNVNTPFLSGATAGGLVGHVKTGSEVTLDQTLASTIISGSGVAGGLVGTVDGSISVTKSYADGYVSGNVATGLMGKVAEGGTASLTDCYAAGYAYPKETGAGLATGTIASATNTYTICAMDEKTAHNYSTATAVTSATKVYYARHGSSEDHDAAGTTAIGSMDDTALLAELGSAFEIVPAKTHTYRLLGQSITQYEHPKLKVSDHYGDWEAEFQPGSVAYYEQYTGGSYGFFGAGVTSTLSDDRLVTGDGYGLVYRRDDSIPAHVTVTLQGYDTPYAFDPSDPSVPQHVVRSTDGYDYVIYPFPTAMMNAAPSGESFYSKVEVSGTGAGTGGTAAVKTFYLNPHFAMTASNAIDADTEIPRTPSEDRAYIRTPRHLLSLSLHYDAYAPSTQETTFTQLRDIDYSQYDWASFYDPDTPSVTYQSPIGLGGDDHEAFSSNYDGQNHIIHEVSFISEDDDFIGFIGMNAGSVENVVLWSNFDYVNLTGHNVRRLESLGANEHVYMGVLAGYNTADGTIRNCAVAGYYLAGAEATIYAYASSHLYGGGFVGGNEGTISNCSSDSPTLRLSTLNADVHEGGFVGYNFDGTISNCYSLGHIDVAWSIGGTVETSGFAGGNSGAIADCYCAMSMVTSGTAVLTHAFCPPSGSVNRCYYLDDGTYLYAGSLKSYNRSGTTAGDPISRADLVSRWSSKATIANTRSYMPDKAGEAYPFRAVVRAADGRFAHYGDWQSDAVLGRVGIFYWEKEEGGTNDGYHFSYIGVHDGDVESGTTLCGAHDDGGVVRRYGYGYLIEHGETEDGTVTQELSGIENSGDVIDAEAKGALEAQMPHYKFYPYVTTTDYDSDCYIRLAPGNDVRDGTWTLTFEGAAGAQDYEFTVSPFFANAMQYADAGSVTGADGSVSDYSAEPGSQANAYEVRSIDQLQHINWNGTNLDTDTVVNQSTYLQFPYLQHATSFASGSQTKAAIIAIRPEQFWTQTHDVYGYDGMAPYTPIAPLATASDYQSYNSVLCAWFGGTYDGQSYKMGNFDIASDCFSVGVFGETLGANMRNIILYSSQGNTIERVTDQGGQVGESPGAYGLGGIVGIAYDYNLQSSTNVIENCAVAGYRIIDRSTNRHTLGGANIGGLAGITGVNLERCSAVADIDIRCTHANGDSAYGSYIHVGGLCGAVRTNVTDCYAGGTIHIDDDGPESTMYEMFSNHNGTRDYNFTGEKNRDFATHIYVGGIGGSAFTVNYTNFTGTSGAWNLSQPVYTRCYTYTRLPDIENNVRGVALIGSIADRYGQGKPVTFNNCYCLQSVVDEISYTKTPYHFSVNANDVGLTDAEFQAILNGDMQAMKHIVHNDNKTNTTPIGVPERISYSELQNLAPTLQSLGGDWGMVTVTEGVNGTDRSIPGKYSFPGNHLELRGRNYPFPTIVTQPDLTFNRTVNVHYGEWPSDGIYWEEGIATIDIFRDHGTRMLKVHDDNGLIVGVPTITVDDPSIAEVLGEPRPVDGGYEVAFVAKKEGATNVSASYGTNTASFTLDVTAKLSITCEPEEAQGYTGDTSRLTLSAFSTLDPEQTYTTEGAWSISPSQYSDIDISDGLVTVTHDAPGYEELSVTFVYTYQGQEYREGTFLPIRTYGSLGLGADTSLTSGVAKVSQTTRCYDAGLVEGTSEIGTRPPSLPAGADGEIFLYESRGDSEHGGSGITGTRVTTIRYDYTLPDGTPSASVYSGDGTAMSEPDEGVSFGTGFMGTILSDTAYDYMPGAALYLGTVPITDVSVTVTAVHDDDAGTIYQFSLTVVLPNKIVMFDANGGSGVMTPIRTAGDSVIVPDCDFDREGYTFAGWTTDGEDLIMPENELTIEGNVTLRATWDPITYYVVFDGNGATDGTMDYLTCAYDEVVELPECGYSATNMLFVGWSTSQFSPVAYVDGDTITKLTAVDGATITLFAQWERTYVLTLNASYVDATPTYQEFGIVNGTMSELEGYEKPTMGLYELAGWATERDGDEFVLGPDGEILDDVPGYTEGGMFSIATDQELYAVWVEPITLVSGGVSTEFEFSLFAEQYVEPTMENGELDGWYRLEDDGTTYTKCLGPDGTPVEGYELTPGETLYAKWVMTKQVVREGWTPNGEPWCDTVEVDLDAGEYVVATMDLSGCLLVTNKRENVIAFGQNIKEFTKNGGCRGMQVYFEPKNETHGNLRPTALDTEYVRSDFSIPRSTILTMTFKKDEFLANGERMLESIQDKYRAVIAAQGSTTTWQVGSCEGATRSHATDYTIKVLYDTMG